MPQGYILCEYEDVRAEAPEFKAIMDTLEATLISKSLADWNPTPYGGMKPGTGQFGKSTIFPPLFNNVAGVAMTTWEQNITALGHQMIMAGSGGGNRIFEDYKVGLAGLAFLDASPKISEIKLYIGDKKLPRINIEECWAYEKPCIIFEDAYLLDEETTFEFFAFVSSPGLQRIKLIGLETNRITDKLLSITGAALT